MQVYITEYPKKMSLVGLRRFWLLLFSLCFLLPAQGAVDALLYQGQVPVASYSPEDWQKALVPALQQVLVKVSGNPNIAQVAAVRKAMAKPSPMVQTFAYIDQADSTGKKALMLQVRFSPKAIDNLLQNAPVTPAIKNTSIAASSATTPALMATQATTPSSINMVISGVRGLQDYTALLDYVRHLEGVLEVNSKQTQGNRVLLVVKINSAMADLAKVIESGNKLVKEPMAGTANPAALLLSYRWVADATAGPADAGMPAVEPLVKAATVQPLPPSPQSLPAAPKAQQLLPRSSNAAPVVEGTPASTANTAIGAAVPDDAGAAQSFAAPPADSSFVPEGEGSAP